MLSIELVVAREKNGVIGKDQGMPWHLPRDLQYFKALTMGHPIVMGRKTAEAIGRPLPGRRNLLISRDERVALPGILSFMSPLLVIDWAQAEGLERLFVIGGAEMYRQFLPLAQVMHITEIDADIEGDTYFPEFNASDWKKTAHVFFPSDDKNAFDLAFTRWERI